MPRSFDMAAEYEGRVEQVHRAFSDEQYWLVRFDDSGADQATLDEMAVSADGGIGSGPRRCCAPTGCPPW